MTLFQETGDKQKCCGCMACMDTCPTNAITKTKDEFGFFIPKVEADKCVACGKCERVCPYSSDKKVNKPIKAFAGLNKNTSVVLGSSSGGLFNAIANLILKDGGFVIGAEMQDGYKVKHICIENFDQLSRIQKSKYIQSDLEAIYQLVFEKLKTGKNILFSGTPCEIAAMRGFLGSRDYNNLVCVDVVCHGVPNEDLFHDYICVLSRKYGEIKSYTFRAKKNAENGMNWYFSFVDGKGHRIFKNWPEDSYNYYYMKSLTYRDSCYDCPFATKDRYSDITLCDYWGWDKYHSSDFNTLASVSGAIANTEKGLRLLRSLVDDVKLVETKYDNISKHNAMLTSSSAKPAERDVLLKKWKEYGYKFIDDDFTKRHKNQILKYKIMGIIPERLKIKLSKLR